MGVLFVNLLFYITASYINYRKHGFNIGLYVLLIYTFVASMALLYVNHPMYDGEYNERLSLFPFIYLFLTIIMVCTPLRLYDFSKTKKIIPPTSQSLNIVIVFIILVTLLRIPSLIYNITNNFFLLFVDQDLLSDIYQETTSTANTGLLTGSFNFISILGNLIDDVIVFILMYYLTFPKVKKIYVIGLIIAAIVAPISGLFSAQRGILVFTILMFIAFYFLFKNMYTGGRSHFIRTVLFVVLSISILAFTLITISRFTKSYQAEGTAGYSLVRYTGIPMLNFDEYGLDAGGIRNGDRTIPLVKRLLVPDGAYNYHDRLSKYSSMKMQEDTFSTFVGEYTLDFGPIGGFLFLGLFTLFIIYLLPKSKFEIQFYEIFPIIIVLRLLVCGWPLSPFADISGNLSLLFHFVFYIFFKFSKTTKARLA